jgi:hypothetical protein
MRLRTAAIAFAGAALASDLHAQTRPLQTEEATTAEAGRLQFEAGADYIASEPNFLTGRERGRWDAPLLRLVYSPARNVELDLEWIGRVIALDDPTFGNVSDWGDVSLRAKWRFLEEDASRPAVAARFGITLPETSFGNGLGPNTLRMSAQLLVTKRVGGTDLHANAGLAIHDEPLRAHEQRDFLAYGIAAVRPLGPVSAVLEVAGLAGRGAPGAAARSELRGGIRHAFGRVVLDGAVRRGLAEADGRWGFTLGLACAIREGR